MVVIAATGLYWLSTLESGAHGQIIGALLLIGAGTGIPWGLMDGLAVSVVPKEQAGMAEGIFNTTRVASECVALAITVVVLTALVAHHLSLHAVAELSPVDLSSIARHLIIDDVQPGSQIPLTILRSAYHEGFTTLLQLLTIFTVLTSVIVYLFLGRHPNCVTTGTAP